MKTTTGILLGCLVLGCTAMARGPQGGDGPPDGKRPEMHKKMLERFDADGDGTLSEAERATAKEARKSKMEKHRKKMVLKHFDEDGDGTLSETERAAAKKAKERRLEKFDKDGDGELSREEHKAARKAMKRQKQGKKKGGCGKKKAPDSEEI